MVGTPTDGVVGVGIVHRPLGVRIEDDDDDIENLLDDQDKGPIIRLVNRIIFDGYRMRAEDFLVCLGDDGKLSLSIHRLLPAWASIRLTTFTEPSTDTAPEPKPKKASKPKAKKAASKKAEVEELEVEELGALSLEPVDGDAPDDTQEALVPMEEIDLLGPDEDELEIALAPADDDAEWSRPQSFEDDVELGACEVTGEETSGDVEVTFRADGTADEAVIRLVGPDDQELRIEVDPVVGLARIVAEDES